MEQPGTPDDGGHDVLSIGESGPPRWVRPVALLVVMLLGLGAYRVLSAPPDPAAPAPAAAQERSAPGFVVGGRPLRGTEGSGGRDTTVRLGAELVTLRGPGVHVPERETSATALGRVGHGWLVRLISKACHGSTGTRTLYGVAHSSGRFTRWNDPSRAGQGPTWRSPDHKLVLWAHGRTLQVYRSSSGKVVATFTT